MDLLAESITEVAVSGEIANTDRVLNIAYGIDRNFLFGAAVSMQSVVMHNPDLAVKFHLFTDYIDEDYLQRVNAFTSKNANVEVIIPWKSLYSQTLRWFFLHKRHIFNN
ncbi:glycosyltransferase, partial [Escherichia coli]